MLYKKYKKLRKYVNGVATDEYKKGELIGLVQANSLEECELSSSGEVWEKVDGEFICEELLLTWEKVQGEFICEEIVTPEPEPTIAPAIMKVETTTPNEIVKFDDGDPTDNYYYRFWGTAESEDGTVINNTWVLFATPGIHTITVNLDSRDLPGNVAYNTSVPIQTIEIVDWGDSRDIARKADYTINTSKVTKVPYGKNLFKDNYSIKTWIEDDGDTDWYTDSKITDVADNIFQNATKVYEMYGYNKSTLEYGIFDWNISEEKYKTIFSYLTNLENVQLLFINKKVTTTLGIFKNNPKLKSAKDTFKNLDIVTLAEDEFSNNLNLLNISGVFEGCTKLTNVPNFLVNKNINNFSRAFYGCTSLKGSTPVDENGYKLWERAGKPGYPATIDGTACFYGCTQLDDYDLIPDDWK